jgi:hypothetical protein
VQVLGHEDRVGEYESKRQRVASVNHPHPTIQFHPPASGTGARRAKERTMKERKKLNGNKRKKWNWGPQGERNKAKEGEAERR